MEVQMHRRVMIGGILLALGTAAAADSVELATGEILSGTVVEQTPETVVFDHRILGRLEIAPEQLRSIPVEPEQPPAPDGPPAAQPSGAAETDSEVGSKEPPAKEDKDEDAGAWQSKLELGLTGAEGNSNLTAVRVAFQAKKETDTDRWNADGSYLTVKSGGETTSNKFTVGLTKDWLMPGSPWFTFVQGRYDYDQFAPWEHRASTHSGLGYTLVKNEDIEMVGRVGGGLSKEFSGERELRPEGLIGAALLRWKLTENQNVVASATIYPDLAEAGEYRVVSSVDWQIKLDAARGISLKIGLANEYESVTDGDAQHSDLRYFSTLVFEF